MATVLHDSDCAVHNEPAYPKGKCDCAADIMKLHDETMAMLRAWIDEDVDATPGPYRLHDMEDNVIVAVDKNGHGGEIANCNNGFGDQNANAHMIVAALNMYHQVKGMK